LNVPAQAQNDAFAWNFFLEQREISRNRGSHAAV